MKRFDCEIKQAQACRCIDRCKYPRQEGASKYDYIPLSKKEKRYLFTAAKNEAARKHKLMSEENGEVRERLQQEVKEFRELADKLMNHV